MNARTKLFAIVSAFLFLGAGCISFKGSAKTDGGLYYSSDRGEKWVQRGAVPSTSGQRQTLANVNVRTFTQDPQDPKALYVGTDTNGAFYSWDGGSAWWSLGSPFSQAQVDAIAVHPKETCSLYVAAGKKIFRSADCTRSWQSSDFEVTVSALAVDPVTPSAIYAGNTKGDILKSTDGGKSWRTIHRLENRIERILIAPPAGGGGRPMVFVVTRTAGLYRSPDDGATWTDLRRGLEGFPAAFEYKQLILAPATPGMLLYAAKYGILRSVDAGVTWQPLTLITAPGTVDIFSIAVNPKRSEEIAYATGSTFYKSNDGGRSWVSKKLPTSRAAPMLHVDAIDGNVLWLGTKKIEK
ncbi:MAG: YCF48-related protein [bacterium]|nr:YCF48-related protein [bacterium]